jgi:hypothetical protein
MSCVNRLIIFTGSKIMSDVKDYTTADGEEGDSHYNGVPSAYGKRVEMQNKMQPKYCEPGEAGDEMKGEKRNTQVGP